METCTEIILLKYIYSNNLQDRRTSLFGKSWKLTIRRLFGIRIVKFNTDRISGVGYWTGKSVPSRVICENVHSITLLHQTPSPVPAPILPACVKTA